MKSERKQDLVLNGVDSRNVDRIKKEPDKDEDNTGLDANVVSVKKDEEAEDSADHGDQTKSVKIKDTDISVKTEQNGIFLQDSNKSREYQPEQSSAQMKAETNISSNFEKSNVAAAILSSDLSTHSASGDNNSLIMQDKQRESSDEIKKDDGKECMPIEDESKSLTDGKKDAIKDEHFPAKDKTTLQCGNDTNKIQEPEETANSDVATKSSINQVTESTGSEIAAKSYIESTQSCATSSPVSNAQTENVNIQPQDATETIKTLGAHQEQDGTVQPLVAKLNDVKYQQLEGDSESGTQDDSTASRQASVNDKPLKQDEQQAGDTEEKTINNKIGEASEISDQSEITVDKSEDGNIKSTNAELNAGKDEEGNGQTTQSNDKSNDKRTTDVPEKEHSEKNDAASDQVNDEKVKDADDSEGKNKTAQAKKATTPAPVKAKRGKKKKADFSLPPEIVDTPLRRSLRPRRQPAPPLVVEALIDSEEASDEEPKNKKVRFDRI